MQSRRHCRGCIPALSQLLLENVLFISEFKVAHLFLNKCLWRLSLGQVHWRLFIVDNMHFKSWVMEHFLIDLRIVLSDVKGVLISGICWHQHALNCIFVIWLNNWAHGAWEIPRGSLYVIASDVMTNCPRAQLWSQIDTLLSLLRRCIFRAWSNKGHLTLIYQCLIMLIPHIYVPNITLLKIIKVAYLHLICHHLYVLVSF